MFAFLLSRKTWICLGAILKDCGGDRLESWQMSRTLTSVEDSRIQVIGAHPMVFKLQSIE